MASNADWVVPATGDERRYFVLDVSDCRRGDRGYFKSLYQAIDGAELPAELPALLDYLLGLDLSDFDHRDPPHTAALNSQKLAGADSLTRFWLDCLTSGEIVGLGEAGWPEDVVSQAFHAAYVDHAHDHGDRRPLADQQTAMKLAKCVPDGRLRRIRPHKPCGGIERPTRYTLDDLDTGRAPFLKAMKIDDHDWPEV